MKIKLTNILSGLKNGKITILGNHRTHKLEDKIKRQLDFYNKSLLKYQKEYDDAENKADAEGMLKMVKRKFEVPIGDMIDTVEQSCFDCGSTFYVIPVSKTEIAYVDIHKYWDLADKSGLKYDYLFTKDFVEECACCKLRSEKKMVSEIEIPTGELIFANYFEKDELYEMENDNISSILGRNELMQYLSTKNVGYGQMGNTSICIFSNKDEVLILNSRFQYLYDNKYNYKCDQEQFLKEFSYDNTKDEIIKIISYLKDNLFEYKGYLSLDVWRWQCADNKVLLDHNNDYSKKDFVKTDVDKGRYLIEHYYDFPANGDLIFSKLKLIK